MNKTILTVAIMMSLSIVAISVQAKDDLLEWKSTDGTQSLKVGGVLRFNHR